MSRFTDKSFVITGGSSGIGLATAHRIVEEGGRVLVTGTNGDKLSAVEATDKGLFAFMNDAGDLAAADALAEEAQRVFGEIDGAFFNAGKGGRGGLVGSLKTDAFRELVDLNVGESRSQIVRWSNRTSRPHRIRSRYRRRDNITGSLKMAGQVSGIVVVPAKQSSRPITIAQCARGR